jgi:hypothetical protein
MSEYQYYEFQAVDRPLTPQEMADLRAISTRARITPMQFQNVYHWGDLKAEPLALVEQYFDAFVYVANWGTRQFMLRFPRGLLDARTAGAYAIDGWLDIHTGGEWLILDFLSDDEEGFGWITDEESESWLPRLLPLRAELAGGDLRALYLGWLAGARAGILDDDVREPPQPPGLGRLSPALSVLAEFLRLDDDLLAIAAEGSPAVPAGPSPDDLKRWVADLPVAEKDRYLLRFLEGKEAQVRAEVLGRFRQATGPGPAAHDSGRTVGDLLAAAKVRTEQSRRQEAARKAAEQARLEREQAAARERYLNGLTGRDDEIWRQIEDLIETKRAKEYDQAAQLVQDLRDLGLRRGSADAFSARLGQLRERYSRRPSFIERLDRAGLRA